MYTVQWRVKNSKHWNTEITFADLGVALRYASVGARSTRKIWHRVTRPKSNGLPKVLAKFKPMRDE